MVTETLVTEYAGVLEELQELELLAKGNDKLGIKARWDFGQKIVMLKAGKKLPTGLLANVVSSCQLSRPEIQMRMKLAQKYVNEDEIFTAIREYPSWHQMIRDGLYERRAKAARPAKVKPFALTLDDAITVLNRLWLQDRESVQAVMPEEFLATIYGEKGSVMYDKDFGAFRRKPLTS